MRICGTCTADAAGAAEGRYEDGRLDAGSRPAAGEVVKLCGDESKKEQRGSLGGGGGASKSSRPPEGGERVGGRAKPMWPGGDAPALKLIPPHAATCGSWPLAKPRGEDDVVATAAGAVASVTTAGVAPGTPHQHTVGVLAQAKP